MFPFTHCRLIGLATAAALFAFPVSTLADEQLNRMGPAGPNEPILAGVGEKRVVAFYDKKAGSCAIHIVAWDDPAADSAMATFGPDPARLALRVRVSLTPGQSAHIDAVDNQTINLQCGEKARHIAVVASSKHVAVDTSQPKLVKASASDF
jgi:hypothetical protein